MTPPFAPPPGLPLPLLDPEAKQYLIDQLELKESIDIFPLLALFILFLWGLYLLWNRYRPKPQPKKTWKDELFEPLIQESASPLTTSELIERVFYKNPSLAEEIEPLLQEIDTFQFSPTTQSIQPLVQKLRGSCKTPIYGKIDDFTAHF